MLPVPNRPAGLALALTVAALGACVDQPNPTEPPQGLRPHLAAGDVILVTNTNGGNLSGSLRAAINQTTGGEVIRFDPSLAGAKITLDTTLDIPNQVTIEGPADKGIVIGGNGTFLILKVSHGATLVNLTITDGKANRDDVVGGILSTGPLILEHSTVSGNEGSFVAGIRGDKITLINSTVANNTAAGGSSNAGINYDGNGELTLINSTVARNIGNGIGPFFDSSLPTGKITLRNSIIANNGAQNCVRGTLGFVYEGKSISDDDTCGTGVFVMLIADPLLGTLADNGGPTRTLALDRNSPAINATDCDLAVDQRYVPRDARCDIGAFEFEFTTVALTIDPGAHVDRSTGSAVITGTIECSRAEQFDLIVDLKQDQKVKQFPTVTQATKTISIACETTAQPWVALLVPPNGDVFVNGDAQASVQTGNQNGITPSATSRAVKLSLSRK
jgi:hypothetical protein